MEISNLPEFKTLVIGMLNKPRGRVVKLSENLNEEIENVFKNQK